jgi:hypothetical protein
LAKRRKGSKEKSGVPPRPEGGTDPAPLKEPPPPQPRKGNGGGPPADMGDWIIDDPC